MSKGLNHTLEKSEAVISDLLTSNPLLASARERVKEQILRALARQALDDLGSPDEIAQAAFSFVDLESESLKTASMSLKSLLLDKIVEDALSKFVDPEASSSEAFQRVDTDDPRLVEAQNRLKSRLIDRLIRQAAEEIDQELTPARIEKPHVAINQIIRTDGFHETVTEPVVTDGIPEQSQPVVSPIRLAAQADIEVVTASTPEPTLPEPVAVEQLEAVEDTYGGSPELDEADSAGYYVYGILPSDGTDPVERIPDESIDPPNRPFLIRHGSIQAIVSSVTSSDFHTDALDRKLKDLEWKRLHKARHIQVLEAFMDGGYTPLPLHFCTVFPTRQRVEQFLSEKHDLLITGLARIQNKHEWGVKIYCDTELLLNVVRGSGDRIDSFIAQLPEMVASVITSEPAPVLIDEVDVISESCKKLCHNALLKVASEGVLNPTPPNDLEESVWTIMNGSYLVDVNQESQLAQELDRLKTRHAHIGLTAEVTGPRPPVSFSM